MDFSVVVPVYNGSGQIKDVFYALKEVANMATENHEMIFVDDGSADTTWQEIQHLHEKDSSLKAIRLKQNFGQHTALLVGLSKAQGNVVCTFDCDLEIPPTEILKCLEKLKEGYDVAGGRRKHRNGPLYRCAGSRIFNLALSVMAGSPLKDIGCPLKVFKKHVAEDIVSAGGFPQSMKALSKRKTANVDVETNSGTSPSSYGFLKLFQLAVQSIFGKFPQSPGMPDAESIIAEALS